MRLGLHAGKAGRLNVVDYSIRIDVWPSDLHHESERDGQQTGTEQIAQRRQKRDRRIVRIDFVLPHDVDHNVRNVQQCTNLQTKKDEEKTCKISELCVRVCVMTRNAA